MGAIVINTENSKLYIIERREEGTTVQRLLTEEKIAQLSEREQAFVRNLQLQAKAMQELARIQEQATLELKQLEYFCKAEREFNHEIMQWIKLGWGYKPKLSMAKPHRAKQHWHRTRSFCVRKGYH